MLPCKLSAKGPGVGLEWGLEMGWGLLSEGMYNGEEVKRYGDAYLSQISGVRPTET